MGWEGVGGLLGINLAGRWIEGGAIYPQPFALSRASRGVVLPTIGGHDVVQFLSLGADVPINIGPAVVPVTFQLADEADFWALSEAAASGDVVDAYVDLPITDQWRIGHADSAQTTWKTSRKLPYDGVLSGVTLATRPPVVLIDATEQTVVASAGPGAGEVYVPDEGDYAEIETPGGIVGTYLKLRYHPIMAVRLDGHDLGYSQHNELIFSTTLTEVRRRRFEVAA